MPVLRPAPRSPIQSPLISQPRPSPYSRVVNFQAATGSRHIDIPARSSRKSLPSPCCWVWSINRGRTRASHIYLPQFASLFTFIIFHVFFFFSLSSFSFPFFDTVFARNATKRRALALSLHASPVLLFLYFFFFFFLLFLFHGYSFPLPSPVFPLKFLCFWIFARTHDLKDDSDWREAQISNFSAKLSRFSIVEDVWKTVDTEKRITTLISFGVFYLVVIKFQIQIPLPPERIIVVQHSRIHCI